MEFKQLSPIILVALLCVSCAAITPTATIESGKNLSGSGISFANAVDSLLDYTTGEVIDYDNNRLIQNRTGLTGDTSDAIRSSLEQSNTSLKGLLDRINTYRGNTQTMKAYFVNLQTLADADVQNDADSAVQSLSASISDVNQILGRQHTLSSDETAAIGAIAGLVARSVQAEKLKITMTRDAPVIARFLKLQEKQLADINTLLQMHLDEQNNQFLQTQVVQPYVDISTSLPADWGASRKQWLESSSVVKQLTSAQEAAKQLNSVWADISSGKADVDAIGSFISDINTFVTTAKNLKAAVAANSGSGN